MKGKRDHNSGFNEVVIPLRGKFAGQEIKVSKYQKARLLEMEKVVLPGSIKAKKLKKETPEINDKSDKGADARKDK